MNDMSYELLSESFVDMRHELSNAQGVHEGLGTSMNDVSYELLSESFVDMRHELSNAQGVDEGSGSSLSLICVTNYCIHHQRIYE